MNAYNDIGPLPGADELVAYLRSTGWLAGSPGSGGTLWTKDGMRIGVPEEMDEVFVRSVLGRIAKAEQRDLVTTTQAVRAVRLDVSSHEVGVTVTGISSVPSIRSTTVIERLTESDQPALGHMTEREGTI